MEEASPQTQQVKTNGQTALLDLSNAQDHKITTTGTVTISCTGGNEGESHTVRIINSGTATVGFSTFFLFPSGTHHHYQQQMEQLVLFHSP